MSAASPLPERIARFESFTAVDPENALLWISLGDLYHQAGRLDDAVGSFERALAAAPEDRVAKIRLAQLQLSRRDFVGAESALRRLLAEAGEGAASDAIHHDLGVALLHQRRFEEALAELEGVADTKLPSVWLYRAQAHHQRGQTRLAVEAARRWVERAPGDVAEGYLALLEFDAGEFAGARERATRVLAQDPENPDASVVLGFWLAEQQEADRARPLFEAAARREPENPRPWLGLGLVSMLQVDFPAAIGALQRAHELVPNDVGIATTLAWARLLARDLAGAEAGFRAALAIDRTFGEAHGGLAVALLALERSDEATGEIRRARLLDPMGFGHVYARAAQLALEGNAEEGTRLLTELLERRLETGVPTVKEAIETLLRKEGARAPVPTRLH